jgi:hypothetical protein
MAKMTSTLDEMEAVIWQRFHNGEDIETVTNIMIFENPEFSEDVVENIVKRVYLKDFKTD